MEPLFTVLIWIIAVLFAAAAIANRRREAIPEE